MVEVRPGMLLRCYIALFVLLALRLLSGGV